MEDELGTKKSKSMTKNKEVEAAIMCWEATNNFPEEEPHKEPEKAEKESCQKDGKTKTWRRTCRAYTKSRQLTKNLDRKI